MKLVKILFVLLFISGCSFFNGEKDASLKDYDWYLQINEQLNFENIQNITRVQNLIINDVANETFSSLQVKENGYNNYTYHLYVKENDEEYDSYYLNEINYINNNEERYQKKVLLNAYKKLIGKYLHTDFKAISITGIKEMVISDTTINIKLNDSGVLEYFNDLFSNNGMYIQEPDFTDGNVEISYVFGNYILKQVTVLGEIEFKNKKASINEVININDAEDFEILEDLETYGANLD
ncbi:MAG: hypothetical protein GX675_04145 [Erysipelotrichaceae bacterium]|nr:hypothetical protein [Erysipelotrichaceae bacterium]